MALGFHRHGARIGAFPGRMRGPGRRPRNASPSTPHVHLRREWLWPRRSGGRWPGAPAPLVLCRIVGVAVAVAAVGTLGIAWGNPEENPVGVRGDGSGSHRSGNSSEHPSLSESTSPHRLETVLEDFTDAFGGSVMGKQAECDPSHPPSANRKQIQHDLSLDLFNTRLINLKKRDLHLIPTISAKLPAKLSVSARSLSVTPEESKLASTAAYAQATKRRKPRHAWVFGQNGGAVRWIPGTLLWTKKYMDDIMDLEVLLLWNSNDLAGLQIGNIMRGIIKQKV